jgi:hypothetical protein
MVQRRDLPFLVDCDGLGNHSPSVGGGGALSAGTAHSAQITRPDAPEFFQRPSRRFSRSRKSRGHAHRFRDTFAVELLLAGVPLERHYSPWVRSRQEQNEQDLRDALSKDPVALMQTKGTPEVHGRARRMN